MPLQIFPKNPFSIGGIAIHQKRRTQRLPHREEPVFGLVVFQRILCRHCLLQLSDCPVIIFILGAKIALEKKDNDGAIAQLQKAVATQDSLKYNEPEDWFFPVRESLGAAFLMNGDAADAERVFREDLERHPRNPRSLFGLEQALKAQRREYDAGFVRKQFDASWKGGAVKL